MASNFEHRTLVVRAKQHNYSSIAAQISLQVFTFTLSLIHLKSIHVFLTILYSLWIAINIIISFQYACNQCILLFDSNQRKLKMWKLFVLILLLFLCLKHGCKCRNTIWVKICSKILFTIISRQSIHTKNDSSRFKILLMKILYYLLWFFSHEEITRETIIIIHKRIKRSTNINM